jgi:hypothetical protein
VGDGGSAKPLSKEETRESRRTELQHFGHRQKGEKHVANRDDTEKGLGMLLFAATMLGIAGIMAVIQGIAAIANSKVYVADTHFVFSNLRTWGWIVLIVGVLLLIAAAGVMNGSGFSRWFGIFAASLSALGQFGAMQAYPFWSLLMFSLAVMVIYALAVYGGDAADM